MARIIQLGDSISPARRRGGWVVVGFFILFVLGCFIYPSSPLDGVVLCPFRLLTGYSCPGCGMTRASILIFQGRLADSLAFHPFAWAFIGIFSIAAISRLLENLSGRRIRYPGARLWAAGKERALLACLVILLGFGAGRFLLEVGGFLTPV